MTSSINQIIRLSRLWDAMLPIISLFLGAAYVGQVNNVTIILLVIIIVLMNSAAILWNDVEDRAIDADNGRGEVAQVSRNRLSTLKNAAIGMVFIAITLALLVSWQAFYLMLLTAGLIWLYNSGPLQVSRRPISSIIVLSCTGAFLPFLLGATIGGISSSVIFLGIWWWLGRLSLSVLKDYKDAHGDAKHGKKTFLLRYGAHRVAFASTVSFIVGYSIFILFAGGDLLGKVLLLGATATLVYLRIPLFRRKHSYRQFDAKFRQLIQYQALLDVGIVIWLSI